MKKNLLLLSFFLFSIFVSAQKIQYPTLLIADSLKQNANAVVRSNQIDILISSQRNMTIATKRVVTVLNEKGLDAIDAIEHYDKKTSVNNIEAIVYNAFGAEIKHIKRKNFRDQCVIDGITILSDSRFIYLHYTPTEYPFTVVYESEVETSNTAALPDWMPLNDYFVSVEKSILNVKYPDNLGFRKKEINFSDFKIKKTTENTTQLSYEASRISAQKPEEYSAINSVFPKVKLGLDTFNLEGVDGTAKTWKEFGQWYADKILTGTIELPDETKTKIKALVGNETNPIKKAQIIYKYVQEKSRYVSIQVGIGGFKPMFAKDVDRLGYGDCKALSNYTRALLSAVDVPSYNTILYGDRYKKSVESDFVSIQGNHMILCVPNGNENVFLECTSQDNPFGYQANFTDDREVLIIKPEGGEIVRTKTYIDKDNLQTTKGSYSLSETGELLGKIAIVSEGSQYSRKANLETVLPTEKEAFYKEYWDNISNLKLHKIDFKNDKQKINFTENIEISAENYAKTSGNNFIFVVNTYNQTDGNLKRIRNRKTPFEISRGFYDTDEIAIALPQNFTVESLPQNFELNTKFGEYKTEIIKKDTNNLVYKRSFFVKKGLYKNTEYEEYRTFIDQVSRNDNAKIILTKKI